MSWFNSGWKYRKLITLSRASGAVTNYQMKLLLGESSGATGEDVDCGGLCKTDFSDIRFVSSNGTILDYWIESISGTTPNQLATIWIEFDSIGTTATTFYMYYGNSNATEVNNGDNTFLFFDDFSTAWNNPVKWTGETASGSVSGGILTLSGTGAWKKIFSPKFSNDIAIRGLINIGDDDFAGIGLQDYDNTSRTVQSYHNHYLTNHTAWQTCITDGTNVIISNAAIGFGTYHIHDLSRIINSGTDTAQGWYDGTSVGNSTTKVPTEDLAAFIASGINVNTLVDWVLVRQYVATEPIWGAWQPQEIRPKIYLPFRGRDRFSNWDFSR